VTMTKPPLAICYHMCGFPPETRPSLLPGIEVSAPGKPWSNSWDWLPGLTVWTNKINQQNGRAGRQTQLLTPALPVAETICSYICARLSWSFSSGQALVLQFELIKLTSGDRRANTTFDSSIAWGWNSGILCSYMCKAIPKCQLQASLGARITDWLPSLTVSTNKINRQSERANTTSDSSIGWG
jgi:hypothetical protein